MKKLTGTLLLTIALLAHVGIIIATEEAYTFSSNEYDFNTGSNGFEISNSDITHPILAAPAAGSKFGVLNLDEQNLEY